MGTADTTGNVPQLTRLKAAGEAAGVFNRLQEHYLAVLNPFLRRVHQYISTTATQGASTPTGSGGTNGPGPTGPAGPPGPPGAPGDAGPANLLTGALVTRWESFGAQFQPVGGIINGIVQSSVTLTTTGQPVMMGYCAKNNPVTADEVIYDVTPIPPTPDLLFDLQGFTCMGDPSQVPTGPQTINLIVRVAIEEVGSGNVSFIELLNARSTWLPAAPSLITSEVGQTLWWPAAGTYQLTLQAGAAIQAGSVTQALTFARRIMFYAMEV